MMQPHLYLIRGLPGSGKTTLARKLAVQVFAADDYFYKNGEYRFDPSQLGHAHAACQRNTEAALRGGQTVAVANTFTQRWELQPYIELGAKYNAILTVIDLFDSGLTVEQLAARNEHGVPAANIAAMHARYEHDWRTGNPIPPWERK